MNELWLAQQPHLIHYIPIASTVLSAIFCGVLIRRRLAKGKGAHLVWWAIGVAAYGLGTGLEATITLLGNSGLLTKCWFVAGAFLGGYPLAQGTVYLLLKRRTANILSGLTVPFIVIMSILVFLSPINAEALEPHKPGGAALGWQWIRNFTPLINTYAVIFLIGGAILSAVRFARKTATRDRAIGNAFIAIGAILPGIGGGMAKAGMVEGLYIGEFVGIILIWIGYAWCVRGPAEPRVIEHASRAVESATASARHETVVAGTQ